MESEKRMPNLRDRVPPANSLIVFEAVARHQSFTKAATELQVSQAAVSRQIQLIESYLGVRLFERHYRAIELTRQGAMMANAVSISLGHIAHVTDDIRRQTSTDADIMISSSVSFASYWLMSRIAKFRAEFPSVNVHLAAYAKLRDLSATGLNFAVRFGKGTWEGVTADRMFGNEILPVCSPRYLEKHGPINGPEDLHDATLLTLSRFDPNWTTWEDWFKVYGSELSENINRLPFDSYLLLISAAIKGDGVALCGERIAEDLISSGELVRPFEASLSSDFSFYLLRPADVQLRPVQAQFRDWLLAEARNTSANNDGEVKDAETDR